MDNFTPELVTEISGYSRKRVVGGCSTSEIFLLEKPGEANLYLKMAPRDSEGALLAEKLRLEWIGDRLPIPQVHFFAEDDNNEYLLISEISGIDTTDSYHKKDMKGLVHLLSEGLQMIHGLGIEGCPFDQTLETQIEAARLRMMNGLVDEDDFDAICQGRKATDLFDELVKTRPVEEDLVFTHGDYCLPNIIINRGAISGFIDWGRAGISDRYQDLSLSARSLKHNFGAKWVPLLFEEYGIEEPDRSKIDFYILLDEFF